MRISSINNTYQNRNSNNNKNTSFKGVADGLVKFWQFVDNGGRAMQFTVEDMCGTNFPRTYKGAMAGYKYTGKINIPALAQEALREFLTGPTMCVVPIFVLNGATKLKGKTANTHLENISNLSYIAKNAFQNQETISKEGFLDTFFSQTIKDFLKQSTDVEPDKEDIDMFLKQFKNYQSADKKTAKNILSDLKTNFEQFVKNRKPDYKNTDFLNVKYSLADAKDNIGSTKFTNYVDYVVSFANDFMKKNKISDNSIDIKSDVIEQFKKTWFARRVMTILSMIVITGFFMSFIPKIYTLASGKVNPNAKTIYDEADKEHSKTKSKVKNNEGSAK